MRPIDRGPHPRDEEGGEIGFAEYGHARVRLIERMGDYCSYCEIQLPNPAVEHIVSKERMPELERSWNNLLLACSNCNSIKGTKVGDESELGEYLWPHQDRTFDAFEYQAGGIVQLAAMGDPEFEARAKATAEMVGLTRRPGKGLTDEQLRRGSDRRYQKRSEAWGLAIDARASLLENDTAAIRRSIVASARLCGFWSVWMTVFDGDEAMKADFCEHAFVGTAIGRV